MFLLRPLQCATATTAVELRGEEAHVLGEGARHKVLANLLDDGAVLCAALELWVGVAVRRGIECLSLILIRGSRLIEMSRSSPLAILS